MRRTTLLPLVVLATTLVVPFAPASSAAPPACDPGPVELVTGGDSSVVASSDHVQGYVLRRRLGAGRSCVVPGTTVQLLARDAGTTTTRVVRTGTTDADGRVQFRVRPPYTVVLTGRSLPRAGFAAVDSPRTVVTVATRLSFARRTVDACRVAVSGRTYPAKPGTPVDVFRRGSDGFVRAGRLGVRSDGTYAGTLAVPCRSSGEMFAQITRTARNEGSSSTQPGPVATRTTTCGQARRSSGEAGAALTQSFEPFNTTTAVHGSWAGERVVVNRTDRALKFDSTSVEQYSLLRRGSTVQIGSAGFSDAIVVTPRELAPGQELREPVRLLAANCETPPPPGTPVFASQPGPAFPAGTSLVGQSLLSTNKGLSVSDRRALTVS